jgi:Metallo-beta-lactamase superfamily
MPEVCQPHVRRRPLCRRPGEPVADRWGRLSCARRVREDAVMRIRFAGSGDAFGSGGRWQTCIHLSGAGQVLLVDCGATSLVALKAQGLDPNAVDAVAVTHLHGDHFGGLPFLILDGQFSRRSAPLQVAGPPGIGARLAEAMEALFPGSSQVRRRFPVEITELRTDGRPAGLGAATVRGWEVEHACGAPPLALRVELGGVSFAYSGDTQCGTGRSGARGGPVRGRGLHLRPAHPLPPGLPDAARSPGGDRRPADRAHPHVRRHARQARRRRHPRGLRRNDHRPVIPRGA